MKKGKMVIWFGLTAVLLFICLASSCTHTRRCIDVESQVYYPCTFAEKSFSWMYLQRYHSYDEYGQVSCIWPCRQSTYPQCDGPNCVRAFRPAYGHAYNPISYSFSEEVRRQGEPQVNLEGP